MSTLRCFVIYIVLMLFLFFNFRFGFHSLDSKTKSIRKLLVKTTEEEVYDIRLRNEEANIIHVGQPKRAYELTYKQNSQWSKAIVSQKSWSTSSLAHQSTKGRETSLPKCHFPPRMRPQYIKVFSFNHRVCNWTPQYIKVVGTYKLCIR